MPRGIRSGLTLAEWPEEDRLLWQAAFETDDIFDDRDRGSHLADATRANYLRDYGLWLTFVAERHPDRLESRPADRVDPEIVADRRPRTGELHVVDSRNVKTAAVDGQTRSRCGGSSS